MSTEENKAFVRRWFEETAVNNYLALVDKTMAPDFVQHDPAGNMSLEQYKQYNTMLLVAFPDISFTVEDMIAEGDKVVTRWTINATHKGQLGYSTEGKEGVNYRGRHKPYRHWQVR